MTIQRFENRPLKIQAVFNDGSLAVVEEIKQIISDIFGVSVCHFPKTHTMLLQTIDGTYDIPEGWWVCFPTYESDPFILSNEQFKKRYKEIYDEE